MTAFATVESLAGAIQRQLNIPLEQARRVAQANLGIAPAPTVAPSVLDAEECRLEKEEQADIRKVWLTLGGRVWDTSAVTRSKITPGFADLLLTLPAWSFALFWETKSVERAKTKDGGRSPEQVDFAEHVLAAAIPYGHGTFRTFVDHVRDRVTAVQRIEFDAALVKAGLAR